MMDSDWRDDEECYHEDYEADINGRATCCRCGHVWYLTSQDIERERKLNQVYDAMMRAEEWRQRVDRAISAMKRLRFWRKKRPEVEINDEVPF